MRKRVALFTFWMLFLFGVVYISLPSLPPDAAGNRIQLWSVLLHYRWSDPDRQKYEAARFLIDNMHYHYSYGKLNYVPREVEVWRQKTDSICQSLLANESSNEKRFSQIRTYRENQKNQILPKIEICVDSFPDIQELDSKFLIAHIDHAFEVWHHSKFARQLSFNEFKEYILPYRSVGGYGFLNNGKELNSLFGKFLNADSCDTPQKMIHHYNQAINTLRDLNGKQEDRQNYGIYGLYSRGLHDCVDIANYACNILRSCGLPLSVEYNMCYRYFGGRHYHCALYQGPKDTGYAFSPESDVPYKGSYHAEEVYNIYRMTYAAQKNSPYFLKSENEHIPQELADPCIIDVTSHYRKTVTLSLPFHEMIPNRLAYLAVFHKGRGGLLAVTWGKINIKSRTVLFEYAIPGMFYFPIYYENNRMKAFGRPFCVEDINGIGVPHYLAEINDYNGQWSNLVLTRKCTYKPQMNEIARQLVGGQFQAANREDFSDAVIQGEIEEIPEPFFQEKTLTNIGNYRYYRFKAPASYPHANISMLEWITDKSYGYKNVFPPNRIHILSPNDSILFLRDSCYVKLLDENGWEGMRHKTEYDGNMQTAPSSSETITLRLNNRQKATLVRFAPLNADNGIHAEDLYTLYYWTDEGWKRFGCQYARYEYVEFKDVPKGKLYWLSNMIRGTEELPFTISDGKQTFIY